MDRYFRVSTGRQMRETETTISVTAESNSSWFSGHFPNNPILPGIAQLQLVADLITGTQGDDEYCMSLSRVKFRKLVRPGDKLDIEVSCSDTPNHYMFKITSGNNDVCSGKMLFTKKKTVNS